MTDAPPRPIRLGRRRLGRPRTDEGNRDAGNPRERLRRALFPATLALAGVTSAWYAVDPMGYGGLAYAVLAIVLIVVMTAGPVARGARPLRVWIWQMLGTGLLLMSLIGRMFPFSVGPLRYFDVAVFSGYACLIVWLGLMARHVGERTNRATLLDASAVAVGVCLAFWCTALAAMVGGSHLPTALLWAVYPIADGLLLALTAHHGSRVGFRLPAMRWLLGALAFLLAVDLINSSISVLHGIDEQPSVTGAYLFFFAFMARAATHPTVVLLTKRPEGPRVGNTRRTALILFSISPAILATAIPAIGAVDIIVRTTLVALLLTILFARLSLTMGALARSQADSHHRATHDQLTGLLNRAALLAGMTDLLTRNAERRARTAVLFIDCDDFKHVNDTWGHHAGDRMLQHLAERLPRVLRVDDVLARHGGDEFVIVATLDDPMQAMELAERVRRCFDAPIPILSHREHTVTPSIGVAVTAAGEVVTTEDMLGRADVAMYEAKARGRAQYVVYDDELAARSRLRSAVGDRLGEAIAAERLGVELQPIMRGAAFETTVGWEALARWHDPELGSVPPELFVAVAEQLGLIGQLGDVVLRRACRELAALRAAAPGEELMMFINVSPAQLLDPAFADFVCAARRAAALPRGCLWLEMTETLLIDQGPDVLATLNKLRQAGARVCIDDFGTGYASLATLLRLPIDCVKIDRSVVGRLGTDPEAPRQLRAIIDLMNSLGIEAVVAEGVETREQDALLRELDCPMAQGWLYGRPAPPLAVLTSLGQASRRTT